MVKISIYTIMLGPVVIFIISRDLAKILIKSSIECVPLSYIFFLFIYVLKAVTSIMFKTRNNSLTFYRQFKFCEKILNLLFSSVMMKTCMYFSGIPM